YAIAADAVSFLVSTGFMLGMRHREPPPQQSPNAPTPQIRGEVKEGVRWVIGHPWLRAIAACTSLSNFFSNVLYAIFVLYLVRSLRLSPLEIGVVLALGSAGAIIGALLVAPIQRRLGIGPTIVGAITICQSAALALPLAPRSFPMPVLILGLATSSFANVAYNITQVSLRQAITPERLQGRMNAGMRWIVWGTIPLGGLVGGAIAQAYGLRLTLWIGATGALLAILPVALTSVRTIQTLPGPSPLTTQSPRTTAEVSTIEE